MSSRLVGSDVEGQHQGARFFLLFCTTQSYLVNLCSWLQGVPQLVLSQVDVMMSQEEENITACRALIQETCPTRPPTLLTGEDYVLCPVSLVALQASFNSM